MSAATQRGAQRPRARASPRTHHAGEAHPAERRVEQLGVGLGRDLAAAAAGVHSASAVNVPREAAVAVVVLAVDVAGDGAADRQVAGPGHHRQRQPVRRRGAPSAARTSRPPAAYTQPVRRRSRRPCPGRSCRAPCRRRSGRHPRSCARPRARSRRPRAAATRSASAPPRRRRGDDTAAAPASSPSAQRALSAAERRARWRLS